MRRALEDAATQAALGVLQAHPIDAVRRFVRTWLLWTMAAAGSIVAYTSALCVADGTMTKVLMTQLPATFLILCFFLALPMLAVIVVKWIIWG